MNTFHKLTITFLILFLLIFITQCFFRAPYIFTISYLNDDAGLILQSLETVSHDGVLRPFYSRPQIDGPKMLRPLQTISTFFEYHLFQNHYKYTAFIGVFWLSISLTLLFLLLLPSFGIVSTALTITLMSFSLNATESILWLSDRHDLFLLLFFTLALLIFSKIIDHSKLSPTKLILLTLVFWGGFFSNEKATILPIVALLTSYALILRKNLPIDTTRFLKLFCFSSLQIISYLMYRKIIFGTFLGGYNDSFLGDSTLSLSHLTTFLLTLISTPFHQISQHYHQLHLLIAPSLFLIFIGVAIVKNQSRYFFLSSLLILISLILSSLPTFQYNLTPYHSIANSRMFWFPLIISSLLFGNITSYYIQALHIRDTSQLAPYQKLLVMLLISPIFMSILLTGRDASRRLYLASDYSRDLIDKYMQICGCVDFKNNDIRKLKPFFQTVNTFTQKSWLKSSALLKGHPECSKPDPCLLSAEFQKFRAVPIKTSPSILNQYRDKKTTLISRESSTDNPYLHITKREEKRGITWIDGQIILNTRSALHNYSHLQIFLDSELIHVMPLHFKEESSTFYLKFGYKKEADEEPYFTYMLS